MADDATRDVQALMEIAAYHEDAVDSLKLFFQTVSVRGETTRYLLKSSIEMAHIRQERLRETDLRSALIVLTAIEAAFRDDYPCPLCRKEERRLSRAFRLLYKKEKKVHRIDLYAQILESWVKYHPEFKGAIGELRGAMKFRHWLAHGRYFHPSWAGGMTTNEFIFWQKEF